MCFYFIKIRKVVSVKINSVIRCRCTAKIRKDISEVINEKRRVNCNGYQ